MIRISVLTVIAFLLPFALPATVFVPQDEPVQVFLSSDGTELKTENIELYESSEYDNSYEPNDFSAAKNDLKNAVLQEKTKNNSVILDVPYIYQRIKYPNGCESVSAVMALQYMGVEIDVDEFISKYLDMGTAPYFSNGEWYACNPAEQFPGDPRTSEGWGCYPEVIKKAVDKMELENLEAIVLKDVSVSTLCSEFTDNGIPVVFWGTIDMQKTYSHITWRVEGTDDYHTWIMPFHCLLLVGYDEDYYYFNDPWQKKCAAYAKKDVQNAYCSMGREALVIVPKADFNEN